MYCLRISWIHIPEHDTVFMIDHDWNCSSFLSTYFVLFVFLFFRFWVRICLFVFLILTDATLSHYFCNKINLNKTQMSDTIKERKCCDQRGRVVFSNSDVLFIYVVHSGGTSLPWYAKRGIRRSSEKKEDQDTHARNSELEQHRLIVDTQTTKYKDK